MTRSRIVEAIPLPLDVDELDAHADRLRAKYGKGLRTLSDRGYLLVATPGEGDPLGCWCHHCDDARAVALRAAGGWLAALCRFMIVCPDCANKRCPRANHHDHACTGSNEPGQPGSAYPAPPWRLDDKPREDSA